MAVIEIRWNPPPRELRWFTAGAVILLAAVAGWLYARTAEYAWPLLLLVVAGALGVVALAAPHRLRVLYLAWMLAFFPVGWLVSHVLLAMIYYGLITPMGLAMRIAGRDPLQRRFDRAASTYWTLREPAGDRRRYFQQF